MKKRTILIIIITVLVICGATFTVLHFSGRGKTNTATNAGNQSPADIIRLEKLREELEAVGVAGDSDNIAIIEKILKLQVMDLDLPEDAIATAEQSGELLQNTCMAQVYIAVAECKMAGIAENVVEKVRWVNKGMRRFDTIQRQWPENEDVYTYQVMTYSNFPSVLGIYQDVLDLLSLMKEQYTRGKWSMSEEQADLLWLVLQNLCEQYPDGAKNREIRDFARGMKDALPVMAARPPATEVL